MQTVTVPMEVLAEMISLQLERGGRASLTVSGSSMMPMLHHHRDAVTLIPPASRQKKGDVILYRRENGRYVLHRIIALTADGYLCSGDNQAMRESVKQEQLLAVVDGFTRNGRAYTCNAPFYRVYTALWVELFCLRRYYIAIRRRLGRLRQRMITK